MKYCFAMKLAVVSLIPFCGFAYTFLDDFNDNDISDWESRCAPATWYAQGGMVHGSTGKTPALLAPVAEISLMDGEVSSSCQGSHAFGIAARFTEYDSGIIAYVSPDHDVARIRMVENGQLGTVLNDISANFPSGVQYTLTLSCESDLLAFQIYVPSTGDTWNLTANDPSPVPGKFALLMGDESGASWDWIEVTGIAQGSLDMTWFTTDDVVGNGNMCLEKGETVDLAVELTNSSDYGLNNTFAVLQSLSSSLVVTQNQVTYGDIPGGSSSYGSGSFGIMAPASISEGVYDLRMTIFADEGFQKQITFSLPVGCGIESDFESGSEGWTYGPVSAGWECDWHVSSQRNHTASGANSFKCGSTGSGDYSNHQYSFIQTPYINVPLDEGAVFWSWIDAQVLSSTVAYDGGILQYRRLGEWEDVEVVPAWSHGIISGSTGPFEDGTPVCSGTSGWTSYAFSVPPEYAGPGSYRFVFGSDDSGNREGWYIDDFSIVDLSASVGEQMEPLPASYLSVSENPFSESVIFSYSLPGINETTLEIYDLSGRTLARMPLDCNGSSNSLAWNGGGLPAGVYFARVVESGAAPLRLVKF